MTSNPTSQDHPYDAPQGDDQTGQDPDAHEEDVEAFDPPTDPDQGPQSQEAADQNEAASHDADHHVMAAKALIEEGMQARAAAACASGSAFAFEADTSDMIQGVGIGTPEFDMDQTGFDGPGASVLNIYTAERMGQEECRRALYDSFSVEAVSDDRFALNVFETGVIDSQPHRHRERPSPCGISVGHFRITAGTQGALAKGNRAPRTRRLLMLSNNHVLANSNNARFGDAILQPGRADGGQNPRDRIAVLERFVPINFNGGANLVDAATGWCWPDRVRKEFIYRRGGAWNYFRVSSTPVACRRGMAVGKSGRTTQLTNGRITGCSETIRVNYGNGRVALFRDQIAIHGNRGDFSQGGDSGSLIWTWDRNRNPVGLLFAGGGGITFANKIGYVLRALDIRLVT